MKKTLIILGSVCVIATAVYAASTQMKNTAAGLQIGTSTSQKVGFFGATPVVRQTAVTVESSTSILSNQTAAAITSTTVILSNLTRSITFASSFDTTNLYTTVDVVTNVVIRSVVATVTPATVATNVLVGTSGTNGGLTNVINALRNLGLAGD